MKKYILDNLPTIWVIAVFVLGMALAANHANANENKSITPKEFAQNISEVPSKVGTVSYTHLTLPTSPHV